MHMIFNSPHLSPEIISVLEMEWGAKNARSHDRPFHALSIRVYGNAVINDGTHETLFRTGDMAFVPARLKYSLRCEPEKVLVIHFLAEGLPNDRIHKFSPENAAYFLQKFRDIHTAWTRKQVGYELECKSILYRILCAIEREESNRSEPNDRMRDAVEYIHDHFTDRSLSIEDLAAQCGMSDTYFRRVFSQNYGTAPLKYIHNLRLTYAKELLQSDYCTIEEVAEKCGFNNVNYFSLFVKKQTGLSPSAYRNHILNDEPQRRPDHEQ